MALELKENISFRPYHTFGVEVRARYLMTVHNEEELLEALQSKLVQENLELILGGGSNILPTRDIEGLVLQIAIKGIKEIPGPSENIARVLSKAGENWHQFVLWTLSKGYGGLENLSLIPGNVGTAPIQNIGAYGVELKDLMVRCSGYFLDGRKGSFTREECQFQYRDSIFKKDLKGKFIITEVEFDLSKKDHRVNTQYGAIKEELSLLGITDPNPTDISNVVIKIRKGKLPDPALIGNAGSFFKNPIVSEDRVTELKSRFPDLVSYPLDNGDHKVAAGWLIDKGGWKGKRIGQYGVNPKQALVLVNYGGATGPEMWNLAQDIIVDIEKQFGILLEPEVNVL